MGSIRRMRGGSGARTGGFIEMGWTRNGIRNMGSAVRGQGRGMRRARLRVVAIVAACLSLVPVGVATAAGAALSVSPHHINLSTVQGTPAYVDVTVTNTGSSPIDFNFEVTPVDQGWSPYQVFNCDSPLAGGATCTITLQL